MLTKVTFELAKTDDFEVLLALRIEAMRESLERLGRFDPERARERFRSDFAVEYTRHVLLQGRRVGLVVLKPLSDGWQLDHLYIHPDFQNQGVGAAVMRDVLAQADEQEQAVHVSALKQSDSNRFYLRHGFELRSESEWDLHYVRPPQSPPQ